jgi:hypothetical protein
VSASRSADDAHAIGVDAVLTGVVTDEPDTALHVVEDLLDGGLGLGDVADGKDRISASKERSAHPRGGGPGRRGLPSARHHEGDSDAVGLGGADDVEGEGLAVAGAIRDTVLPGVGRGEVPPGAAADHE